jgi:hypothetical protein
VAKPAVVGVPVAGLLQGDTLVCGGGGDQP